jgi:hypothetical protein
VPQAYTPPIEQHPLLETGFEIAMLNVRLVWWSSILQKDQNFGAGVSEYALDPIAKTFAVSNTNGVHISRILFNVIR